MVNSTQIVLFISYFSVAFKKKGGQKGKGNLGEHAEHFRGKNCPNHKKLPKILMQNRPKDMKFPEISTP